MNRAEFEAKYNGLMQEAEQKLDAGNPEEAEEIMNQAEELKNGFEKEAKARANLEAMNRRFVPEPFAGKNRTGQGDVYDSEEYKTAFMNFCTRGEKMPEKFRNETATTANLAAVIPTTTVQEIIRELREYGNLYAGTRKLNIQGGVKFPVSAARPTAVWVGEGASDAQAMTVKDAVQFSYYGLECKIAQSTIARVVTYEQFQTEFVAGCVEAIVAALEKGILSGAGDAGSQMTGITRDSRVPKKNIISMTAAEMNSYSGWAKKVLAKIPKAYRRGCFVMAQGTYESYINGMVDADGQPIGRVNYGIDGAETYRFAGKTVETVENDLLPAFDDAAEGEVTAVFLDLRNYAINSNMQMTVRRWTDENTNTEYVKVMLVADGKLLDPNGVLIIKKAGGAADNGGEENP